MPFPLVDGAGSPALDELVGGPVASSAVALVVAPHARASGWGRRAAIALAHRCSTSRRALLVDLDLTAPSLHRAAGVPNDEGIIDVIEYGVSAARVIRTAKDESFDLIPAGEFTADPGAVLASDAWNGVVVEAAVRRTALWPVVPLNADRADVVIERAGAVVILAEPEEIDDVRARVPDFCTVLAVLTPPEAPAATALQSDSTTPAAAATSAAVPPAAPPHAPRLSDEAFDRIRLPKDRQSREALIRDLRDRYREERIAAQAEAVRQARSPAPADPGSATAPAPAPAPLPEPVPEPVPLPEPVPVPVPQAVAPPCVPLPPQPHEPEHARTPETPLPPPAPEPLPEPVWGHDSAPSLTHGRTRPPLTRPVSLTPAPAESPAPDPSHGLAPRRRSSTAALAASVLLLVILGGAAWYFFGWRFTPAEAGASGPLAATEATGTTEPAAENVDAPSADLPEANLRFQIALPYVVAVAAYRNLQTALEREADLIEIEPEMRFHIESIVRDGVLFHHVMAGPVPDSAAAVALRDLLIERGHKTAATPTDIRSTPLAFLIGDYGSQIEAHQQLQVLRSLDLAGYIIDAAAADGRPVFRLYVGGFGSRAEAEAAAEHLRGAGIQDSVVTRTGSIINSINSSDS